MMRATRAGTLWPRLPLRALGYDLFNTVAIGYFWTEIFGLAAPSMVIGLFAVRHVVIGLTLRNLYAPALRFARGEARTLDDLIAAERALDVGRRRFVLLNVTSMSAMLILSMVLGFIGVPVAMAIGPTEFVTAILFALGLALAIPSVLHTIVTGATNETQAELAVALSKHERGARRVRGSIVRSMVSLQVSATLGVVIAVIGIGGVIRVQALRATVLAEQRAQAELGAARLRETGTLEPGLELVDEAELPPSLVVQPGELRGATLLRAGLTVAAAALGDGRFVLARVETDERLDALLGFAFAISLLVLGPLLAASLSHSRGFANELRQLRTATQRVVAGDDLRTIIRPVALRDDEFGLLARDFNIMLEMFDELAGAAARVASGDLRVELERPGDLHEAFRAMVRQLSEMVTRIRVSAVELATAASQIRTATGVQEHIAGEHSSSAESIATAASSLASSTERIASTSGLVRDNAEQTLATTNAVTNEVAGLHREIDGISALLDVIREVANRSDLLALNGSLEATRAGEAGRGFALVASEMRRLAERVSGTVADVRTRIGSIEAALASTVAATGRSRELVARTAEATREISAQTERQSDEARRVALAIDLLGGNASSTVSATSQTRAAAEQLAELAAQLEQLTRQFELRDGA